MRTPLTESQSTVYEYIKHVMASRAFPPSYEEIANACGLKSLSTVSKHLDTLERKGWIRRDHGVARRARSIVLLEDSDTVRLDYVLQHCDIRMAGMHGTGLRLNTRKDIDSTMEAR